MLALFGLLTCIGLNAPWYYYVVGFLCLAIEANAKK